MRRIAWLIIVAGGAGLLTGCVEQKFVIHSYPPGAAVIYNGQELGATPVDYHYTYTGKYHFTLIKDGYATQQVVQDVPPRWYQRFPLDFVADILLPWKIQDRREFSYTLEPLQTPRTDQLLNRAETLRSHGHNQQGKANQTFRPPDGQAADGRMATPAADAAHIPAQ